MQGIFHWCQKPECCGTGIRVQSSECKFNCWFVTVLHVTACQLLYMTNLATKSVFNILLFLNRNERHNLFFNRNMWYFGGVCRLAGPIYLVWSKGQAGFRFKEERKKEKNVGKICCVMSNCVITNVEFVCAFFNFVLLSDSGPLLVMSLLYLCVCMYIYIMFSSLVLPHLLVAMVLTKAFCTVCVAQSDCVILCSYLLLYHLELN